MWRAVSSEAAGGSSSGGGGGISDTVTPAWVWVDVGIAWAIAPAAGGSLQLSLWRSIAPSWLCVTGALVFGLRAEEVALDGDAADGALLLFAALAVCGVAVLAVGYQILWEQARDAGVLVALEERMSLEDHKRRQTSFSELLLRHLVTEPSLQVLEAGVRELFKDSRIFAMHSDALEQIQDGVDLLTEYGDKALRRLKSGASELPSPVLEKVDMEEILDACLRTTAYLAVSRDHHKVQLDLRVAADVDKVVKTYSLWLSQMTRACLLHALHPDEKESVILRVSYTRPGWMRVGIEALWRVAAPANGNGDGYDRGAEPRQEERRTLSGWDRDMPEGAWWVRAAALSLGGEADYDRSKDREGFHELWFTIPAENVPGDELQTDGGCTPAAAAINDGHGTVGSSSAGADATGAASVSAAQALFDDNNNGSDGEDRRAQGRKDQAEPLPRGGRRESLQAAEEAAAATGAGRAARRASRRESAMATALAPLPETAGGAAGAGALEGAVALPRPGGWAGSVVSPPLSGSPLGLPPVRHLPSPLPAIRDIEGSPRSVDDGQRTQVTAFETDDTEKSGGPSAGRGSAGRIGTATVSLGRGYRSSLGGTLVSSGGGGSANSHAERSSSMSARHGVTANVPVLHGIRVSQVESIDGLDCGGGRGESNGRPASAPGPARTTDSLPARSQHASVFPPLATENGAGNGAADNKGGLSRSAPNSPKGLGRLSGTVKRLLGTKDGLAQLRESLHDDDDNDTGNSSGKAIAAANAVLAAMGASGGQPPTMMKAESVATVAGQRAAGVAAARLSGTVVTRKRPSSAPSPVVVSKKSSVFGGLVQTLVESNSMSWLGTTKLGSTQESQKHDEERSQDTEGKEEQGLEILLVDPSGLVRWVVPRLKERQFSVTVAHSAEEAMEMIQEGSFRVAVVDLHMPRMAGTEFCRRVRAEEIEHAAAVRSHRRTESGTPGEEGGGSNDDDKDDNDDDDDGDDDGAEEDGAVDRSIKLLLHTTSAGSVRSDELEDFLEEGLVEEYVPHPLDVSTLFDFLKLFDEEDDQYGTRKMSSLLGVGEGSTSIAILGRLSSKLSTRGSPLTAGTGALGGGREGQAAGADSHLGRGFVGRVLGIRPAPPPPSVEDIGSTFFAVKGRSREAHAAVSSNSRAGAGGVDGRGGGGGRDGNDLRPKHQNDRNSTRRTRVVAGTVGGREHTRKLAGPWRPGTAAVSPGLGPAEERGG
eukprot:g10350.t1